MAYGKEPNSERFRNIFVEKLGKISAQKHGPYREWINYNNSSCMHNVLLSCRKPDEMQSERMGQHGAAPYVESNIAGKANSSHIQAPSLLPPDGTLRDPIQTTTDRHAIRI